MGVRLLTSELEGINAWRTLLEGMAESEGAEGRVARRIRQPRFGRPEVNKEWPRALLDAPCAWGKTIGSIKLAFKLFRKHCAALGTVAVFEHRLDLIKQVKDEWIKWAKLEKIELELYTVCSLNVTSTEPSDKRSKSGASSSDDMDRNCDDDESGDGTEESMEAQERDHFADVTIGVSRLK